VKAIGNGRRRQYATPRPDRAIKAAAPSKIGRGSAINLKIENQIPPKAWAPHNNETPARLSGGSSNRNRENKSYNQEESTCGTVF